MSITWRDILIKLQAHPEELLDQPVEIMLPQADGDVPVPLVAGIALETIGELCDPNGRTRSSVDNQHHPERLVLLADFNLFAEDGSIGFDLVTGERVWPGGARRN